METNGEWEVPDGEKGLHASGHACGLDLLEIAHEIRPQILIPIHSQHPEFYVEHLSNSKINVLLPASGGTIEI